MPGLTQCCCTMGFGKRRERTEAFIQPLSSGPSLLSCKVGYRPQSVAPSSTRGHLLLLHSRSLLIFDHSFFSTLLGWYLFLFDLPMWVNFREGTEKINTVWFPTWHSDETSIKSRVRWENILHDLADSISLTQSILMSWNRTWSVVYFLSGLDKLRVLENL